MRKCRESISLYFLIISPFPLHFLILSPFPRSPAARLQGCSGLWHPVGNTNFYTLCTYIQKSDLLNVRTRQIVLDFPAKKCVLPLYTTESCKHSSNTSSTLTSNIFHYNSKYLSQQMWIFLYISAFTCFASYVHEPNFISQFCSSKGNLKVRRRWKRFRRWNFLKKS